MPVKLQLPCHGYYVELPFVMEGGKVPFDEIRRELSLSERFRGMEQDSSLTRDYSDVLGLVTDVEKEWERALLAEAEGSQEEEASRDMNEEVNGE